MRRDEFEIEAELTWYEEDPTGESISDIERYSEITILTNTSGDLLDWTLNKGDELNGNEEYFVEKWFEDYVYENPEDFPVLNEDYDRTYY